MWFLVDGGFSAYLAIFDMLHLFLSFRIDVLQGSSGAVKGESSFPDTCIKLFLAPIVGLAKL